VDYRGTEVTVENFLRLLTGRHDSSVARSKRLLTDERSNLLVYLTGHGGDEFLKFNDQEEMSSFDLADALEQMHLQHRYNELLFIADTCQAATLHRQLHSPHIAAIGSSRLGENSYSHHVDGDVGISVIDRFTYYTLDFFERHAGKSHATLADLFSSYDPSQLLSHADWRTDLFSRPLDKVLLTDFFGSVSEIYLTPSSLFTSWSTAAQNRSVARPSLGRTMQAPDVPCALSPEVASLAFESNPPSVHGANQRTPANGWSSISVLGLLLLLSGLIGSSYAADRLELMCTRSATNIP